VLDQKWFAGDDGASFVGTVTTTSVINEGDYREAKRTTSLAAQTAGNLAIIRQELQVTADLTQATANSITVLSAAVTGMEATVEETASVVASLDGALSSSWQVKTQVRTDGRVVQTGVALGAAINPDGTSRSEFLVMADTIAFLNSVNGQLHAPFIFDVANDTAFLNSLFIKNGTITNAMIGAYIQSDDYVAGVTGWRLSKTGTFELNSPLPGGGRMRITPQQVIVYDNNGIDRVTLGYLP